MATDAQRKARNKNNAKNQVTKPVAFYKNTENDLIEYVLMKCNKDTGVGFSTYVKDLIRQDMSK